MYACGVCPSPWTIPARFWWKTSNTGRSAALEPPPWSRLVRRLVAAIVLSLGLQHPAAPTSRRFPPRRRSPGSPPTPASDGFALGWPPPGSRVAVSGPGSFRGRRSGTSRSSPGSRSPSWPSGEPQPLHQQVGRRRPQAVLGSGAAGQWPLAGTGHAGGVGERARSGIHGQGECDQRPLAGRHRPGVSRLTARVTRARAASPSAAGRARRGSSRCLTGCRPARRCLAWGR